MIRAVITDCFGIFYADPVSVYRHDGITPLHTVLALADVHERAATGELSRQDYIERASRLLQQPTDKIEAQFFGAAGRDDKALAYIGSLRPVYKTILLSNAGAGMVEARLSPEELQQYFDKVVLSYILGAAKPDPAIYSWICEQLSLQPGEVIAIDDNADNCEAARAVGMHVVMYRDFEQTKAEVDALLESKDMVNEASTPA